MIVGLFVQQTVALFVLKTGAGYSLFRYIADLAYDFLTQAYVGAEFFFDAETIAKNWFFVNTVRQQLKLYLSSSLTGYSFQSSYFSLQLCRCFITWVFLVP